MTRDLCGRETFQCHGSCGLNFEPGAYIEFSIEAIS